MEKSNRIYALNEEEFKNYDMDELVTAVRGGLDIYSKMEEMGDWGHPNFYEAAIRYGTAELVNACIDMGASPNCTEPRNAEEGEGSLSDFTVGIALSALNAGTLQALLERGANPRYLYVGEPSWHLWLNLLPEADHVETLPPAERERLTEIQEHMRNGAEIIKILRDAGILIPGMRPNDDTLSLYSFWQDGGGGWRSDLDDERRWDELDPEEFEDFNEAGEYYSETRTSDGWGCCLPAHGSRSGALWHAASPEALRRMLDEGADVNMRDENGYTALHHIAYYGCSGYYLMPEVMMQMLIDAGADIDDHNDYGACPLLFAAEDIRPHPRALELVKVLLRNGANFNACTRGNNGLVYWSSKYWYTIGSFENAMLQEGALELVRSVAKDSETLKGLGRTELTDTDIDLMTTAFWGTPEDLKPILDRGANINVRTKCGYTPLMFASVYNYAEAVRFLADRTRPITAELDVKNDRGETPFSLACKTGDHSVISELITAGVNLQEAGTPFDKLWNGLGEINDLVEYIINSGVDLNMRDNEGVPLFMSLIGRCDAKSVESMLEAGANAHLRDSHGNTALMYEAMTSHSSPEVLASLLEVGIDINARNNDGETALFYAAYKSVDRNFIIPLLENGADVNIQDKCGYTALDILLNRDSYDKNNILNILPILLKAGAVPGTHTPQVQTTEEVEDNNGESNLASALKQCKLIPCDTFKEAFEANGDAAIASIVTKGFPFDLYDETDLNVFYAALRNGMTETIEACLEMGKDVDENWSDMKWIQTKSFPDSYPLYHAINAYSLPSVKFLLEAGAETSDVLDLKWRFRVNRFPEAEDTDDEELIAEKKELDAGAQILKLLHEKEPAIPCEWNGHELTYTYVGVNSMEADRVLSGDDLSKDGEHSESPKDLMALRLAVSSGAVGEVIAAGIDVNVRDISGKTALHYSVLNALHHTEEGCKCIVELIKAGADVNAKDKKGQSPLSIASDMVNIDICMLEIVMTLLRYGANAEEIIIDEGNSSFITEIFDALKCAYMPNSTMKVEDAELLATCAIGTKRYIELISAGADVNVRSRSGFTPLMFAVGVDDNNDDNQEEYNTVVLFLIKHGADLNAKNADGDCALTIALKHGCFEALSALISAGADTSPLL